MAKRGKPQARRQGTNSTPVWAWLLIGLFVGALSYFTYQQIQVLRRPKLNTLPIPNQSTKHKTSAHTTEPPTSGTDDGVLDTDYSFYDVLPTQETVAVTTDADDAAQNTLTAPASKSTATDVAVANETPTAMSPKPKNSTVLDNTLYLLQAGSFERSADADDLKARIALSGESAHVEQADVQGKVVYRVRLGPYNNAVMATAVKTALADQGIHTDRIKIK
jgi:cell division septation protein DedD